MKTINDGRHEFKQVAKITGDYAVWNIPSIGEGCIPLFQPLGDYRVNGETLQYIQGTKEEAKLLAEAASWNIRTLADCQKAISSKRKGNITERKRFLAQRALATFEKYTK